MANNWRHWKSGDPDQTEHFLTPLHHSYPPPAPGTCTTRSSITTCGTSTISSKLRGSSLFRENDFQKQSTKWDFSEKSLSTFFLQRCELVHVTYMTSPHESRWDPVLPVVEENHCTPQGTKKVRARKIIRTVCYLNQTNPWISLSPSSEHSLLLSLFSKNIRSNYII